MQASFFRCLCLFCLATLTTSCVCGDQVDTLIAIVAQAGPQGVGSSAAREACGKLATREIDVLPRLLVAMDTPNVVAANWYRTVYATIVAREAAEREPNFPIDFLQQYATDSTRQGRPRRLVLQLLDTLTPTFRQSVIPTMIDDPEFRSDAVSMVLQQGEQAKKDGDNETATQMFRMAFRHARDSGQITRAADRLKTMGVEVSIVDQMGFVPRWHLLGPFDAPERSGFDAPFPPESAVDLDAKYVGKDATEIAWHVFASTDRLAQLNLIQAIASVKEAVGYAYCVLDCAHDQEVELRCGADDNLTVWLNGTKILARRQWLNGTRLDRFTAPASLKRGRNEVLVKVCQGPQHKNPAVPNNWSMQLRFCDAAGGAAQFEIVSPARPITSEEK